MANEPYALTAQQRLAMSRRALVNQLQGKVDRPAAGSSETRFAAPPHRSSFLDRFEWATMARKVGERWWRRHPANAAGRLAVPVLERYTRRQPFKAVGIAAATGAIVVLVRPWRLLSLTAVVAAVLKTSDVADMVTTLLQKNDRSNGA